MKLISLFGSFVFAFLMLSAIAGSNGSASLWRDEPSMWTTPKTVDPGRIGLTGIS